FLCHRCLSSGASPPIWTLSNLASTLPKNYGRNKNTEFRPSSAPLSTASKQAPSGRRCRTLLPCSVVQLQLNSTANILKLAPDHLGKASSINLHWRANL